MSDLESIPPAAEFGALTAFLRRAGLTTAQVRSVIGNAVGGRTRGAIVETVRDWTRGLPKRGPVNG